MTDRPEPIATVGTEFDAGIGDSNRTRPLFSVVIPTRERPETLSKALATCLAQEFDDYEIIVCDNASGPETKAVVQAAGSSRVVYLRAPMPLAMSANWELAISAANGQYVVVIGDDDGLMPYALRELSRLIQDYKMPPAIHWRSAHYSWPSIKIAGEANYLSIPVSRDVSVLNGRKQLKRAACFEIDYHKLPTIYSSVVRRDIIEEHRRRAGRLIFGIYPDVYTAFAFAYLCESYISVTVPMHMTGLSGRSNGVAALTDPAGSDVAIEFYGLHKAAGYDRHPTVPDYELFPVHADDSFQHAKDALFPDDTELALDRMSMLRRYLAAIPDVSSEERARIVSLIRLSAADRPDLLDWFDAVASTVPPGQPFRIRPTRLGFDGQFLHIDTTRFGVTDICGAVALATDILQINPQGIKFDLPVLPEVVMELSEALAESERSLLERSNALKVTLEDVAQVRAELEERSQALETTLSDLAQVRAELEERSQALETTLSDLAQVREALEERSHALEATLEDLTDVRATLVERTHRLEAALK